MNKLQDSDRMPFGKYKGDNMIDIPAFYLLYLLENNSCTGQVKEYILENKDALLQEQKKQRNSK